MTLLQALLIALFGYLSSNYSPWCFGQLGGWYTMGRPLVSGLIIGVILGDVRTGILMGAAVQTLYIGLVTPGLSMPADLNFAAYMGIPLAMVAGASTEYALSLSVPLSFLGVSLVSTSTGCANRNNGLNKGRLKKRPMPRYMRRYPSLRLVLYRFFWLVISVRTSLSPWFRRSRPGWAIRL